MIYLDHNATTPLAQEVKDALAGAVELFGNPSSSHRPGRAAKEAIEQARAQVARLIGSAPDEIVFTSGGTEANNLALIGAAYRRRRGHVITSSIEHPSVLNPVRWLETRGFEATYLPVDEEGLVDPYEVSRAIRKDTVLISIMHSNNETGVLQLIDEIGIIARQHRIPFHSDAAQSVGKVGISVAELPVDMLTIVSHKFYGPKGVGALYIRNLGSGLKSPGQEEPACSLRAEAEAAVPDPIMFGAGHERGMRPGTENILGIVGLGTAAELATRDLPARYEHMRRMRDLLHGSLLESGLPLTLNGHPYLRLPNTLNISIKGIVGDDLVERLKEEVAFSAGSACHAGRRTPSAVLTAMGVPESEALSAVRLSVGKDTSPAEVEDAVEKIVASAGYFL
ncbi:MAG: cysteine desulfurase family protein [Nitrospirota bacterium]